MLPGMGTEPKRITGLISARDGESAGSVYKRVIRAQVRVSAAESERLLRQATRDLALMGYALDRLGTRHDPKKPGRVVLYVDKDEPVFEALIEGEYGTQEVEVSSKWLVDYEILAVGGRSSDSE